MIENSLLYNSLEKIIMNEKNLGKLKESITKVSLGKLSAKELKQQILTFRIKLIDKVFEYVQYCIKNLAKNQQSEQVISINNNSVLKTELNEKDKLLVEMGQKVKNIIEKLKEKVET